MLAYVYYPVTTAVYFERASRTDHQVVSIGPKMDEGLIQAWNLQAMRQPIRDQQIPTEYETDLAALFRKFLPSSMHPDLYLWVGIRRNGTFPGIWNGSGSQGMLPHRQPSEPRMACAMGETIRPCVHRAA